MQSISISRDPLGLYPMYYAILDGEFVYGADLSIITTHPNFKPVINDESLNELFAMGPAHSLGKTPFANVFEVIPGHTITYDDAGLHDRTDYSFRIKEHTDSYEDTVSHVRELLASSIYEAKEKSKGRRVASLLSGGLDSSYISAMIQDITKDTFSFEFEDCEKYFTGSSFQPSLDRPYVEKMVQHLGSSHRLLTCSNEELVKELYSSIEAHQIPAMGDIDTSLIFFLKKIARDYDVVFTGECADELFAGYPWYHRKEMQDTPLFPWSRDMGARLVLLKDTVIEKLHPEEYCREEAKRACADIGLEYDNTPQEYMHHRIFYLTIRYFMTTLIDRTNCAAKYSGLTALVPFADTALAEYLFNVPYDMKARNGQVKNLLVECAKDVLPDEVRLRKKSPFPKTYDPHYEKALLEQFDRMLQNHDNPILEYLDIQKTTEFLRQKKNLGTPWFGQLMCGPQLLAYYLQINEWLKMYV